MKLSQLTPEQKTQMLAEMDGWNRFTQRDYGRIVIFGCPIGTDASFEVPSYLTSYDAIIPLIQKQPVAVMGKVLKQFKDGTRLLYATPDQLLDALLVAAGRASRE